MPLKLTCPHCGHPTRLSEPLPLPGNEIQCETCGRGLAVSYPAGVMEQLKTRGKEFQAAPPPAKKPPPRAPAPPKPGAGRGLTEPGTAVPTMIDKTQVAEAPAGDAPSFAEFGDRTVPSSRTPYGGLPGNIPEPEVNRPLAGALGEDPPSSGTQSDDQDGRTEGIAPSISTLDPAKANKGKKPEPPKATGASKPPAKKASAEKPVKKRRGCLGRLVFLGMVAMLITVCAGGIGAGGGYFYFSKDLPSTEMLQAYRPPTVTVVYDKNGEVLGEIYEEQRYVLPLEEIPKHVQDAFIAAEDGNFWEHGGVDYVGLFRAVFVNMAQGRKAQGASTITQQVTRGFLLTNEKTYIRKIKEILLAWRIENTYTKEHILYLYLNEIYLGSSAYGVEAASRVYFDKHVKDITVAEAAILAGLPQRPSEYSPHKSFDSAKARQEYVIGQMVRNGFITQAEGDAALKEEIRIVERRNEFLEQAPWFTEHVRRHVVEKYGEDKVLREGLQVYTTCDLALQKHAQTVVGDGVYEVDQRMGFRRTGVTETLKGDDAIAKKRAEVEAELKKAWARAQDPAGRIAEPEKSVLEPGRFYTGVLLEVNKKWARVAIGAHEGIIPLAYADWAYPPDPRRSWRTRDAIDMTEQVDDDGDGKKDGGILRKGDVVTVRLEAASAKDEKVAKHMKGTPAEGKDLPAVRLWQVPEVEAAMLSFDLDTGAVRAMVGGGDFGRSQFNRATQGYRQVGSTFKPVVYGAALDSRKITTASVVADAPLAFATEAEFVWKPTNYAHDYEGNMTLRRALAMSKNTCTVRVIDAIDPGMNEDVVYKFARKLGIGGPPTHLLPEGFVPSPDNDHLCPWTEEKTESTICMDHFPPRADSDTNMGHRAKLTADDHHQCRTCDYSMALGSASLTMEELLRAYSAFGTGGKLVQPYYIEEVRDRDGNVLEKHEPVEPVQVIDPGVAFLTNWLLQGVVNEGTAAAANGMGLVIAGKTGTSNDEKDAWFVGLTPNVITGVWVGYDQPRTLGVSSTGGKTALPIWMDYMKVAAPKESNNKPFPVWGDIEWALIDEKSGNRVTSGGRSYPFLKDTAPESTGVAAGQATINDVTTDM
jgi:penicillin-binding protein 1A